MLNADKKWRSASAPPLRDASLPVLDARDVAKSYRVGPDKVHALRKANISVAAGELICLTGASGSGKSTLLNTLAGIEAVDEGSVNLLGHEFAASSDRTRAKLRLSHVGVVFQSHNLVPELTAEENVALPLMARGYSRRDVRVRVEQALSMVDVGGLAARYPTALSGGQRQRVGIARALAGDQEVLLADEPTGALDSGNSKALYSVLRRLCDEVGLAVVLATHDEGAADFCNRSMSIREGITYP